MSNTLNKISSKKTGEIEVKIDRESLDSIAMAGEEVESPSSSKMTTKEKKEIIKSCANAVGIEITPAETKNFLQTIAKNSHSSRHEFYHAAKSVLAAYKQRLDQESQQMMLEIRDEFAEAITESDRNFAEGVRQTFRDIQEFSTESSRKSQANLAALRKALDDGSLFDF